MTTLQVQGHAAEEEAGVGPAPRFDRSLSAPGSDWWPFTFDAVAPAIAKVNVKRAVSFQLDANRWKGKGVMAAKSICSTVCMRW